MVQKHVGALFVGSFVGLAASQASAGIDFRLIDRLSDGTAISSVSAQAVSADGSYVVGTALVGGTWRGFSWGAGVGASLLEMGENGFISEASDVSDDGSVIVGTSGFVPVAWRSGKPNILEHSANDSGTYEVGRISADGRTAIGHVGAFASGYRGLIWRDGLQHNLPTGMAQPTALSADGGIIFGYGADFAGNSGVGRALFGGKFELITPGAAEISDVSYNGSVAVGTIASDFGASAVYWDANGASHPIFSGDSWNSSAFSVSRDGTVIVGNHELLGGFIWTSAMGPLSIADYLTASGVNLDGWSNLAISAISGDGHTIVGTIVNSAGDYVGWVATVPAPASLLMLGSGMFFGSRRRR